MGQISVKLPEEELVFLEWYTKKHASPKASVYRDATIEHFRKWKQDVLLNEYIKGDISIKEFCRLATISFFTAMNIIEESGLEPLIPDAIIEYTSKVTEENIKKKDLSIFKNKKPIKRTTQPIHFENDDEEF